MIMSLTDINWKVISSYAKNSLLSKFDTSLNVPTKPELKQPHQGFYMVLESADGSFLCKEGLLSDGLIDLSSSVDRVVSNVFANLSQKNVSFPDIRTSVFHLVLILNNKYIVNPLDWEESSDGIYFQWGQDYRALYLPCEINKMKISKIEILDRLCAHEAKIFSSAWRMDTGLCFRLTCSSFEC